MEIDWAEVSKSLGTRLANAVIEAEQWKFVAEKLHTEKNEIVGEVDNLKRRIEDLEQAQPTEEPSSD